MSQMPVSSATFDYLIAMGLPYELTGGIEHDGKRYVRMSARIGDLFEAEKARGEMWDAFWARVCESRDAGEV